MRLVVGIAGATGAVYGIRLLEVLRDAADVETHLVISREGRRAIETETDVPIAAVEALATAVYDDRDSRAALAGGPLHPDGMVVAPCGTATLGALASCDAGTLVARAGDVTLKEGKRLVVVVGDPPWHLGELRRMEALARMGGVILPPMPAFYPRPRTVDDLVNHTVGRVLDRFALPHALVAEWTGTGRLRRAGRGGPA
jgi:4-hydroxy-3-polyprenylbenzoate decarboxylase